MKKIVTIILVIIFGFLCVFLGYYFNNQDSKDLGENYFVKQGYSFEIPEGWSYDSSLGVEAVVKENAQDETGFSPYIVFLNDSLAGRTKEQFIDYVKNEIKNSVTNYELLEEIDDGIYHIVKMQGETNDKLIIFKIAFLEGLNDSVWFITLNDNVDSINDNESIFNNVYKSFELR